MRKIIKNNENILILRFNEDGRPTKGLHFVLEFISKTSGSVQRIFSQDLSTHPEIYNLFKITDLSTPDALNSQVNLDPGEYMLRVYEVTEYTTNPGHNPVIFRELVKVYAADVQETAFVDSHYEYVFK
jgi:hypothetical protein